MKVLGGQCAVRVFYINKQYSLYTYPNGICQIRKKYKKVCVSVYTSNIQFTKLREKREITNRGQHHCS